MGTCYTMLLSNCPIVQLSDQIQALRIMSPYSGNPQSLLALVVNCYLDVYDQYGWVISRGRRQPRSTSSRVVIKWLRENSD